MLSGGTLLAYLLGAFSVILAELTVLNNLLEPIRSLVEGFLSFTQVLAG